MAKSRKRQEKNSQRTGGKPPPIEDPDERQSQLPPAAGEYSQSQSLGESEVIASRMLLMPPIKPEISAAREAMRMRAKVRLRCNH